MMAQPTHYCFEPLLTQEAKIGTIFSNFKFNISNADDWLVRTNRQQADITPDVREEIMIKKVRTLHLLSYLLAGLLAFSFFLELNYWLGIWILHNFEFLYYYFSVKMSIPQS